MIPKLSVIMSPYPPRKTFGQCLSELLQPEVKAKAFDWPDDGTYITINDGFLTIFKPEDNLFHPLIVSEKDIMAEWVIINDEKN